MERLIKWDIIIPGSQPRRWYDFCRYYEFIGVINSVYTSPRYAGLKFPEWNTDWEIGNRELIQVGLHVNCLDDDYDGRLGRFYASSQWENSAISHLRKGAFVRICIDKDPQSCLVFPDVKGFTSFEVYPDREAYADAVLKQREEVRKEYAEQGVKHGEIFVSYIPDDSPNDRQRILDDLKDITYVDINFQRFQPSRRKSS